MATRIPAMMTPPFAFAHRGAKAQERDNTIEAFRLAVRLGATGIESDTWLSADGIPVLDHDGVVGRRLTGRKPIGAVARADLPEHIPTLAEYYEIIGTDLPLSLDMCDLDAFTAVVEVARRFDAFDNLWFCTPYLDHLLQWRAIEPKAKLVHSIRPKYLKGTAEKHAAKLAREGIQAMNMRQDDWTGGLVTLYHRFEVLAFSWDAQYERTLDEALDMGVDAVYSDYVDRMVDAVERYYPTVDSTGPSLQPE